MYIYNITLLYIVLMQSVSPFSNSTSNLKVKPTKKPTPTSTSIPTSIPKLTGLHLAEKKARDLHPVSSAFSSAVRNFLKGKKSAKVAHEGGRRRTRKGKKSRKSRKSRKR
uniref:Uncharacterized protein n=1 Tax=viral metagenome TaxID=1070528 RepID=A0A6C0LC06_9ZZZZ